MNNIRPKAKSYKAEFKESSVKLAINSKQPIAQTAKELGINANTLYTWIDKYSKPKEGGMRSDEHIYEEVKQLKKELTKVKEERDLLKKAAAYFARQSQ